jgi:hypothetical protein
MGVPSMRKAVHIWLSAQSRSLSLQVAEHSPVLPRQMSLKQS